MSTDSALVARMEMLLVQASRSRRVLPRALCDKGFEGFLTSDSGA